MASSQEENQPPKNPLSSWAWIFIALSIVLNLILIPSKKYHWYYLAGDLALLWFAVLWLKNSPIAAKVFLFNYIVSFFTYQMAYVMNILERPTPLSWAVSIGLGVYGGWAIFKVQAEYNQYLQKLNKENVQSTA